MSTLSWGTVLPLNATVGNATDQYLSGLVIQFQGAMGLAERRSHYEITRWYGCRKDQMPVASCLLRWGMY